MTEGTLNKYLAGHEVLDAISDGISIHDRNFVIRFQNQAKKTATGNQVGNNCYKAYMNNSAVCTECPMSKVFEDGKTHTSTKTSHTDGGLVYIEVTASPIVDNDGNIIAGIEIIKQMTERRMSERKMLQEFTDIRHSDETHHHSIQDWNEIFNTITDMITIHDADFNIINANAAARKNLKLPSLEKDSEDDTKCFKYYHGTACPPGGCPSCECVKTGVPAAFEIFEPYLKKDIEIRALPRFDNENNIIGVIHITRDISHRKRSEKQLKDSSEQLRKLTAHLTSVREEERKHIAREIHDELAQLLTALNMDLFWLHRHVPDEHAAFLEKTDSMLKLIDRVLKTVSRISSELRPGLLDDLGLQEAMEWQADEFQSRTDIKCTLSFKTEKPIDQEYATTIFRIFQETLTNVARHAEAKKIDISLTEKNNKLILQVIDNGKGITDAEIKDPEAFGLIGIRERVYFWRGKVSIKGVPGKGTSVTVSIPINAKEKKEKDD